MAVHPFAGRLTRVLSVADLRALVSVEGAIETQREAFIAHAFGHVTASPNAWLRLPGEQRGWLKLLSGYQDDTGALGVKILARFPNNPPGANLGSLVVLFDSADGFPLAIMDGTYITAVRTGVGAGLATQVLAAPGAETVGLVGTGVVGWYSLQAVSKMMPHLKSVRIFSRSEDRREGLAGRVRAELGLAACPVDSVDRATDDADILITATNSPTPVLNLSHLRPGQHVNAMGIRSEVAAEVMGTAYVVPDGRQEAIADGKVAAALAAGLLTADQLGDELGVLLSRGVSRYRQDRTTVFDSSGIAVQDVAMARQVFMEAEQRGLGVSVDLGLALGPL